MNRLSGQRRCRLAATLLASAGWLTTLAAAAASINAPVSTETALASVIDAHLGQPRFAGASWGIAVVSLDTGRTLYAHRAEQLMQPASTAKLFTAALSLSTLGASFHIPTRLLATGEPHDGRLNGPLILYGMGDPTLGTSTSADWAQQLAGQLSERGVRQINGDLIADDSYFTGSAFGSGWEASDLQSWFAAPSSALSVDENVVELTVTPASTAGLPADLGMGSVVAQMPIRGEVTTTLAHATSDINLYRAPGDDTLYAFGTVAARTPPQHFKLAAPDPALIAGSQLRKALADSGIKLAGKVRTLHWPEDDAQLLAGHQTLAEIQSPALMEILQRGLKRSQNLYLQNVYLSVGAHLQGLEGSTAGTPFASTTQWSVKALHQLTAKIGIAPAAALIDEGTGLSRRDLVTPAAMTRLLAYLAAQPYADMLHDALPVAGVDGTLTGQMRHTAAENNLHAKTGSMTYVHCLVGYVTSAAGERLAFAIMLNNYEPPAGAPGTGSDVNAIALMLANFTGKG